MAPKISVVMPVWNGAQFLRAAVESVLGQTFGDFEFIIVDDGSTDGTLDILSSFSDERIKLHQLEHGGIVSALNLGVSVARGDWIARQDADDVSLPERFAAQLAAIQSHPDAILCYTDVSLIGEEAAAITRAWFPRTQALLALRLCYQNPIVHSTVLFRKEAFLRAGGYLPGERHAEDFALWGRMLEQGGFLGLTNRLVELRLHSQSVSRRNLETQAVLASAIALKHCRRFMRLNEEDARRALEILSLPPHARMKNDWRWFLQSCAHRLRWKSNEARVWLLWQTFKRLKPFQS